MDVPPGVACLDTRHPRRLLAPEQVPMRFSIYDRPSSKYVIDAMEDTDKADGLLQRFQVMVYPDLRSNPTDIIPDAKARNKAYEVFENLANLDAGEFGAAASPHDVPTIGFSEEAQEIFDGWRAEFEPRYGSKDQLVAIQSHMLKFRSLFASLALIFEA